MSVRRFDLALCLGAVIAFGAAILCNSGSAQPPQAADPPPKFTAEQVAFFETEVQPILNESCVRCHGEGKKIGGRLNLTSRAGIIKGGVQGSAVSLEKPESSLMIRAINYDDIEMPPSAPLKKEEIATLTKWVAMGLPWTPGADKPAEPEPKVESPASAAALVEAKNYWAYRPLTAPAIPAVKQQGWGRNAIDAFVLAKLEEKGLAPAPPADRVTLIRRAYYDLTGLPPTPEQVDAFLADRAADAYEKLIDRLLEYPQYGEKWGRHWLDLVRYAETNGYERDGAKPFAWRYRDYVIDAFNNDKPYDVFLREQLAGDELDEVTPESLIATGYYRLGIWDDEPADKPLAKYDVLDGIVSTTSQVVLGMTVGCARCHDHKKDPIPQRDYYRLLAFFHDVTDMNLKNGRRIATPPEQRDHERLVREKADREAELSAKLSDVERRFAAALAAKKGIEVAPSGSDLSDVAFRFYRDTWEKLPDFETLKPETTGTLPRNMLTLALASRQEAFGIVFEGKLRVPAAGEYLFDFQATAGLKLLVGGKAIIDEPVRGKHQGRRRIELPAGATPFRLEYFNAYDKPLLKLNWSGPGFQLRPLTDEGPADEGRVLLADSRTQPQTWIYTTTEPSAEWTQPTFDDQTWQRGPGGFGTKGTPGAVVRTEWKSRDIWLRRRFAVETPPRQVVLQLHHDEDVEIHLNGQLIHRAKGFSQDYRPVALGLDGSLPFVAGENLLAVHCRQTAGGQYIDVGVHEAAPRVILAEWMRRHGAEFLDDAAVKNYFELADQLDRSRKSPIPDAGIEVMAVEERGRQPTKVLLRGNPQAHGEDVEPGIPVVLDKDAPAKFPARDGATAGRRRALADWLTGPGRAATARALANRLWQFHFGRGIAPTPNDFGQLGEAPTHPELLEWLADQVRGGGWRIKRMHKIIMLSSAYRMSSQASESALAADPANNLFWRFNPRRLAAEEVRDSILAVSGVLNLKAGGPSVFPSIPKEVLAGQSVPGQGWGKSTAEEASRRSVYVHVKRSLLVPVLAHHDQADTDSSCPVRYTTTVPTQALGMLNGEFSQEQAALLAKRLEREHPDDRVAQIRRAIRLTTARTPADPEVTRDTTFVRDLQTKNNLTPEEALRQYCLLILNTNEFIYLD